MRKILISSSLVAVLALAACGESESNNPDAGTNNQNDAGADAGVQPKDFSTASKINAYLDGKKLTMEGDAIPSHPNGYNEDVNFGAATQCYHRVTMTVGAGTFNLLTELGTLKDAPNTLDVGDCDRTTKSGELTYTSSTALVENVEGNGECFDFTVNYTGFAQEGRGSISEDGTTLRLELFFAGQASGHRCADGAVGSGNVTLQSNPFTGNAVQVYTITEN